MIKEYYLKDGSKRYYFQIYLGKDPETGKDVRTTKRGFKTKKEASIAMSRLKVEFANNKTVIDKGYTFEYAYEMWFSHHKTTIKDSTQLRIECLFKKNILPCFAKKRLNKITIGYCQKCVDEWQEKYSTYRALKAYTSMVFEYAIRMNMISDNPMKHVESRVKKNDDYTIEKKDKYKYYDKETLQHFLSLLEKEEPYIYYTAFRLLAFSGLRKGELLGLQWKDINLFSDTLTVNKTLSRKIINSKSILAYTTPKTSSSYREIKLDKKTIDILKYWKLKQKELFLKLGIRYKGEDNLVFSNKNNEFMSVTILNRCLKRMCERYGFEDIHIHGFRHTHCSLLFETSMVDSDGDIQKWMKAIQQRLGHKDIQTTMNIYTHITPKVMENVSQKFADYVNF